MILISPYNAVEVTICNAIFFQALASSLDDIQESADPIVQVCSPASF
jgi:hypothetical protein